MSYTRIVKFHCNKCGEEAIVHHTGMRPAEKHLCMRLDWEKLGTGIHLCIRCKLKPEDRDDIVE